MDLSGSPARLSSRTCAGCCCLLPSLQQAAGSRRVRGPFQGDFQFLPEDAEIPRRLNPASRANA